MTEEGQKDELTFEPVRESAADAAMGLILESLRPRGPDRTIR